MATKQSAKAPEQTKPSPAPVKKPVRHLAPAPQRKQTDPSQYNFEEDDLEPEAIPAAPEAPAVVAPPAASPPRNDAGQFVSPKPQHSQRLTSRALQLGVTQQEIDSFTSDELIDEVFAREERFLAWRQQEQRQAPGGPLVHEHVPPAEPEDNLGLDEDVHPSISAAIKRLAKENKELRQELTQAGEREKARENETRNERIDRAFQGLTEYHDVIGAGRLGELTPEELARRQAVLTIANADQSKNPLDAKIIKAVKTLYPRSAPKAPVEPEAAYEQPAAPVMPPQAAPTNGKSYEDEELAKRRSVWNQSGTAQPTDRRGAEMPKGIAKAKQTFIKLEKEAGRGDDALAIEQTAELPD